MPCHSFLLLERGTVIKTAYGRKFTGPQQTRGWVPDLHRGGARQQKGRHDSGTVAESSHLNMSQIAN